MIVLYSNSVRSPLLPSPNLITTDKAQKYCYTVATNIAFNSDWSLTNSENVGAPAIASQYTYLKIFYEENYFGFE